MTKDNQTIDTTQGIVKSHNKWVLGLVIILIIGLATGAFVLSFKALTDLALGSAIDPELAWIWPLIIDGFIVTATVAVFSLRGRGFKVTWYPWAALLLFAVVSVFGNSLHAGNNQDKLTVDITIASLVSAAPAVALLLASHFLVIMISTPRYVKVSADELLDANKGLDLERFEEPKLDKLVLPAEMPKPTQVTPTPQPVRQTSPVVPQPKPPVLASQPVPSSPQVSQTPTVPSAVERREEPQLRPAQPSVTPPLAPVTTPAPALPTPSVQPSAAPVKVDERPLVVEVKEEPVPAPESVVPSVEGEKNSPFLDQTTDESESSVPDPAETKPSDSELEQWALDRIAQNLSVKATDIQEFLGSSLRTAQRRLAKLREKYPEMGD